MNSFLSPFHNESGPAVRLLFRTPVDIPAAPFQIQPAERVLCVGSCFADEIGRRFQDDHFPAVVNPYGVMYNPASILHSIEKLQKESPTQRSPLLPALGSAAFVATAEKEGGVSVGRGGSDEVPPPLGRGWGWAIFTLGTNHVYIERATSEIVDNCQKRPQQLFEERCLSVDECAGYLQRCIDLLRQMNPEMHIIFTVSPIRYRKYGYHESQLSKATLLLAIEKVCETGTGLHYFPAYEILLDELRDYRFYKPDMLHPSEQAIDYIYRRFQDTFFSSEARQYVEEWRPIREALAHRPFQPDSPEYLAFKAKTEQRLHDFEQKWMKG